jgi:hypothetical protein
MMNNTWGLSRIQHDAVSVLMSNTGIRKDVE